MKNRVRVGGRGPAWRRRGREAPERKGVDARDKSVHDDEKVECGSVARAGLAA